MIILFLFFAKIIFEFKVSSILLAIEKLFKPAFSYIFSGVSWSINKSGKIKFKTNHAGGILGGISSGQDIVASFAVKPTSSILTSRDTIDKKGKNTKISVKGRHDPCVGIRAVPIGEAMINCVLLDHLLMHRAQCG